MARFFLVHNGVSGLAIDKGDERILLILIDYGIAFPMFNAGPASTRAQRRSMPTPPAILPHVTLILGISPAEAVCQVKLQIIHT